MSEESTFQRRGVLKAAGGALGAVPTFTLASGRSTAAGGPTGLHVGAGEDAATRLTVGWTGDRADEAYVEYGRRDAEEEADGSVSRPDDPQDQAGFTAFQTLSAVVSADSENVPGHNLVAYRAELEGLEPNTRYVYRAVLDDRTSDTYCVKTAPDGDGSFSVTAWGDHGIEGRFNRADSEAPNRNVELASELDSDLHLGVGDISYANGYPNTWENYFETFEAYFAERPQLTVPGNHEREPGQGFQQYDARLDALLPSAAGRRWFDVTYGNTAFVGLNSEAGACPSTDVDAEEYVPITDMRCGEPSGDTYDTAEQALASEQQADYLREALSRAEADPDVTWTVVFVHSGWYTTSEHAPREDLRRLWEPVIDEFAVDLVVVGHNHVYERTHPISGGEPGETGTTYVTSGASGTSFYTFEEPEPEWLAVRQNTDYGAFTFDVSAGRIRCRFVTLDGETFDEFHIVENGDGEPTQREVDGEPETSEREPSGEGPFGVVDS
jgi:hypothetical protein